eukprot:scaffold9027_cov174-Amphora_coffeaeformis.AAC.8
MKFTSNALCALSIGMSFVGADTDELLKLELPDDVIPIEDYVPLKDLPPVMLHEPQAMPCGNCTGHQKRSNHYEQKGEPTGRLLNSPTTPAGTASSASSPLVKLSINFEGVGDFQPMKGLYDSGGAVFDNFAIGLIDYDAGGSGWFANEPSKSTAMWFPNDGLGRDASFVRFTHRVKKVGFSYSSATALSRASIFLHSETTGVPKLVRIVDLKENFAGRNCTGDTYGIFCNWDEITIPALNNTYIGSIIFEGFEYCLDSDGCEDYYDPYDGGYYDDNYFEDGCCLESICSVMIDDLYYYVPEDAVEVGGIVSPVGGLAVDKVGGSGGDPHFLRWNQERRDSFHGECDLVLMTNKAFNNGQGLDVHLRTTIRHHYSYIESAAIIIGQSIVQFDVEHFTVAGMQHSYDDLPFSLSDGGHTFKIYKHIFVLSSGKEKKGVRFDLTDDSHIEIIFTRRFLNVNLQGGKDEFGSSKGMLGDFTTGEMVGRRGQKIDSFVDYGFEWQVTPEDPQLFAELRAPQLPNEKCRMPSVEKATSRQLRARESLLKEEADQACAGSKDFDLCVEDVLVTGELDLADVFF